MVAPASDGLLHAVVSESGGLSAKSLRVALANTKLLATAAGCYNANASTSPEDVKKCMVALPALNVTSMTYVQRDIVRNDDDDDG